MKNYTITVNGNVYDVTVEEGTGTGAAQTTAPVKKAAPRLHQRQQHQQEHRGLLRLMHQCRERF